MKPFTALLIIAMGISFWASAMAVPPGNTVSFKKVVFDGKAHADAGLQCSDCHDKIFEKKKGAAKMTMKDIYDGKYCGECHNGKRASSARDVNRCDECHKRS